MLIEGMLIEGFDCTYLLFKLKYIIPIQLRESVALGYGSYDWAGQ